MPKTFAEALQTQLDRAGITAYRLHQLTGLSQSTISRFLSDGMHPTWDSVQKIAKVLGVGCDAFQVDDVPLPEAPTPLGPGGRPKDEEQPAANPQPKKNPKRKGKSQ